MSKENRFKLPFAPIKKAAPVTPALPSALTPGENETVLSALYDQSAFFLQRALDVTVARDFMAGGDTVAADAMLAKCLAALDERGVFVETAIAAYGGEPLTDPTDSEGKAGLQVAIENERQARANLVNAARQAFGKN